MANVLIIDDSEFFRNVYSQGLIAKGFQVETAPDGKSGLEKMVAVPPDLVFLDLVMPGMTGEDVLKEIQKYKTLEGIPIIMLTSISAQLVGKDLLTAGPLAGYLKKEEASVDDVIRKAQEVLGTSEKAFDPKTNA
jgi:CheY-like chemotaxis protein